MTHVVRLLRRFWAFCFPVAGWRKRLKSFRSGNIVWRVPGHPEFGNIGPWPSEWTPFAVTVRDGNKTLAFLNVYSDVSGRLAENEDAVACCRCGVHLHVQETEMKDNLDVPSCPWCSSIVEST